MLTDKQIYFKIRKNFNQLHRIYNDRFLQPSDDHKIEFTADDLNVVLSCVQSCMMQLEDKLYV